MTIDDVVALACHETNTSVENEGLWFEILVYSAIKSVRSARLIETVRDERMDVYMNKFTLPKGTIDVECIFTDIDHATETKLCGGIDYSVQGDLVILATDLGITDGTTLFVTYRRVRHDLYGNPYIPDDFERALVAYCGWKYHRKNYLPQNRAIMEDFRSEWARQLQAVR